MSDEPKRPRGRPRTDGQDGAVQRVNLTLDAQSLAIAAAIHPHTSAAVRQALAYWAQQHPEGMPDFPTNGKSSA